MERAKAAGVVSQIITGGSLKESRESLKLAKQHGTHYSQIYKDSHTYLSPTRFLLDRWMPPNAIRRTFEASRGCIHAID
jgi:Tat protein secretion system quality control protein TatD with DNase activity